MKNLSKIVLVIFMNLTFFTCTNSENLSSNETQEIQPEQFGQSMVKEVRSMLRVLSSFSSVYYLIFQSNH